MKTNNPSLDRITRVLTRQVGSGPVLAHYFHRLRLVETIDAAVPGGDRRVCLTHGEAVAALITMLLNGRHALYAMEEWARQKAILAAIFPQLPPEAYTDDRLAATLDGLYQAGLAGVHGAVTTQAVQAFDLPVHEVHHDTTSFSFYGAYTEVEGEAETTEATQPQPPDRPPQPRYGYSRDRCPDLKQVVAAFSVQEDGVPLLGTSYDGNQADGPNYLEHWRQLSEILGHTDFLYLGDTKLADTKTLLELAERRGQWLCPAPLTTAAQREVFQALQSGEVAWQEVPDYPGYRIWETSRTLLEGEQSLEVRQWVVHSQKLAEQEERVREKRLQRAEAALAELAGKLNRRGLKERCAIEHRVAQILERERVRRFLAVEVSEQREQRRRQVGRGRPGPKTRYREEIVMKYALQVERREEAREQAQALDGIFLLISNAPPERLDGAGALRAHKGQWVVERAHRELKGPIPVVPLFLHKPERIAALVMVCVLALLVLRLLERAVRERLAARGEPLRTLLPNRRATERPRGVVMLAALETIQVVIVERESERERHLGQLSELQQELLELLGVPREAYERLGSQFEKIPQFT